MSVECPVARMARERPDAIAIAIEHGAAVTYGELDAAARRFQGALAGLPVARGGRVALLATPSVEVVALLFAAARAGVALGILNARLTAAEIAPLVARLAPAALVASRALAERAPGARLLEDLGQASDGVPAPGALDLGSVWTTLFTSGTTGAPKGAELTVGSHLASARASATVLELDPGARFLCNLPLFHVGGIAILVRCALAGGTVVLHDRFDASAAARALASGAVTHASLVATTLARTLDAADAARIDLARSAATILVGGGPLPAPTRARALAAGLCVLQTYGLTEAASQVTCERPGEADGETAGHPMPGVEVRVVDGERSPLPPGRVGEIAVLAPTLLRGYLGDPEATRAALADGWLYTGDVGELDRRGRLRVHARRTDLVLSGGENVYPAEVEAVLLAHPSIADAAVAAEDDVELGQATVALIVTRGEVSDAELSRHCRARLAGYKVPRRFLRARELPRNAAGKLDRAAVAELARARR